MISRKKAFFKLILFLLLFFISFSYLLYGYQYFNLRKYHYDEAISTYGAVRILEGGMPYKDFWTLYAPGQFYITAAVFNIFGASIKIARIFAVIILSLTCCGVYFLVRKICPKLFAILAFLFLLALFKSYMVYNRPGQLAILFFVLSCFAILNYLKSKRSIWLATTGILVGVTGLFRQDFGFYIFIPVFLLILLKEKNQKERSGLILRNELLFFLGFLLAALPLLIYFLFNSALGEFINDAVIFPVTTYSRVRDLPFPAFSLANSVFYAPLFIFLLTGIRLLSYNWRGKIDDTRAWMRLFLLFVGLGLFNYTNIRTHLGSLLPTMIPAIILFICLLDDFLNRFAKIRIIALAVFFMVSFTLIFYSAGLDFKRAGYLSADKIKSKLDIARAEGFYDDSELAQSQASAIRYIQANTGKSDKIFVGNLRHDRVVNSDVMFYFLAERNSATKYYELHPGLTNTEKIQKEIIGELTKSGVRYIILWSGSEDINEPNESSRSSGITELDDYIRKNYKTDRIFGAYLILKHV